MNYNVDVVEFPLIVTDDIRANLVTLCGSGALQHNVGTDEDIRNLSGEDCDTSYYVDLIA